MDDPRKGTTLMRSNAWSIEFQLTDTWEKHLGRSRISNEIAVRRRGGATVP